MNRTREILADLILLGGFGAISYGAWVIFEPAGFISGGIGLILLAFQLGRTTRGT